MTTLPDDWSWSTLGELGDYQNGRGFKRSEWAKTGRPIIRIQNLTGRRAMFNYFDGEVDPRHVVQPGDLLLSWAATLGVFFWDGPEAVLNQHIFKVRSRIDVKFHYYLLQAILPRLLEQSHGSGMVHITKTLFDRTAVPVPPLREQERIVAAIEEEFSRLDAAAESLHRVSKMTNRMMTALIADAALGRLVNPSLPREIGAKGLVSLPPGWKWTTVGEVGSLELGRQRAPKYHTGPNMRPYLRVANVFEDRIDLSDVKQMHFSAQDFAKYRLQPNDILLNEGQSPEWLGRPAMFRGELPNACFTNTLIRFRAGPSVSPAFALLVFRHLMRSGRLARESRITTNIAHLSVGRLKHVEFPLPPLEDQTRTMELIDAHLSVVVALRRRAAEALRRGNAVRKCILRDALAGHLVPSEAGQVEEVSA